MPSPSVPQITTTQGAEPLFLLSGVAKHQLVGLKPTQKTTIDGRVWTLPATPIFAHRIARALPDRESDAAFRGLLLSAASYSDRSSLDAPLETLKQPPGRLSAWPHQVRAFNFGLTRPAFMLECGMGTGKSKMTLDLIVAKSPPISLVVCPASVVDVWPFQIETHIGPADDPTTPEVILLNGLKNSLIIERIRSAIRSPRPIIFVIHFEQIWREPLFSYLLKERLFDALIVDESHRAKNDKGKTSVALGRLAAAIPMRLELTGTPLPHSPLDIFAQYRILDPGVFGTSYHRFKTQHAVMGGFRSKQVLGYRNMELFKRRMDILSFRVSRDVLELPPTLHERRTASLSPRARRVYDAFESDFYASFEGGEMSTNNSLTKLLRLQQLTSGYVTTDDGDIVHIDTAKRDLLHDTIRDLPTDEPVAIFCNFRTDLDAVHEISASLGRGSMELSGHRKEWREWLTVPTSPPDLAVQIQAGGVGVDLTRARYCIYYSVGLSLGDYLQSEARVHRPGQERSVFYIHLLIKNTVDEKIRRAQSRRRNYLEELRYGPSKDPT